MIFPRWEMRHAARNEKAYNIGGSSSSDAATTNTNTTNSNTTNNSSNSSSDWSNSYSSNSTNNSTDTLTQDRRLVNDHGVGISADNSNVTTSNSGNSTTSTSTVSSYVLNTSDFGAISASKDVMMGAMAANSRNSDLALSAATLLGSSGLDMLKANIDYSRHVSDANQASMGTAIDQIKNQSNNALAAMSAIAAKPLDAQNPQHILVIVGLVVFGVFAFKSMKG